MSIDEFERFVRETKAVLKGVARAAGGSPGEWILTDLSYGSAVMSYAPGKPSAESETITRAIVDGYRQIEAASAKPSYFSERALAAVRRLSGLGEGEGISVSTDGMPIATLSPHAGKNIDVLLKPARRYYGSIVGSLDVLSVHTTPYVMIYADRGDVARCYVAEDLIEGRAKDMLGSRVVVSGQITANRLGNVVSILGDQIFEAPARHNRLPSDTAGKIPNFTGDRTIAAHLEWARRELQLS